tara:strand:+ start:359 stop:871 length:513 start_codon:yes stop_codon:yes gene_type:complete
MQWDSEDDEDHFCRECDIDLDPRNIVKGRYFRQDWICNSCWKEQIVKKKRIWHQLNKEKSKKVNKIWQQNNKDKMAFKQHERCLKQKYNMSPEEYQNLLEKQQGLCAVCIQPETFVNPRSGIVIKLAADHCHETGKIRQLLCRRCNIVLGLCKEDKNILTLLNNYINIHK